MLIVATMRTDGTALGAAIDQMAEMGLEGPFVVVAHPESHVDVSAVEGIPDVTIETARDCPRDKAYVFTAAQFAEMRGEP